MKKLALLVVYALGLSSNVYADTYSVKTAEGASCNQNESGRESITFGTRVDPTGRNTSFEIKYKMELGTSKRKKINCGRLYNISVQTEQLKLEREMLQLKLLKLQIKQASDKTNNVVTPMEVNDDW